MSGRLQHTGTILGGLPIVAVISYGQDGFTGEFWSEVDEIYWRKKDGTSGRQIPQHIRDRAEKYDHGFSILIESIFEQHAYERNEEARQINLTPQSFST